MLGMFGIMFLLLAITFTMIAVINNLLNLIDQNKEKKLLRARTASRKASSKSSSRHKEISLENKEKRTGLFYDLSVVTIIAASLDLLVLFLTNQFSYIYVARYSSVELSTIYKITAFWAGQEGSFLLWVLMFTLIGLMLNHRKNIGPGVKLVFGVLQIGLLIILIAKNPFIQNSQIVEGQGLSPLLQNFWMISHPPFLFLGYAALAVPFALAVGSLLDGNYKDWAKKALPFSLVAWASLGIGIYLGAYWAYEVLGWGGYWAWDPVENSSLIPWVACGGLVHFLILSLRKPSRVKPAYVTAIFSFGLALYGTFLTRSGVLSDFSSHSFADEGLTSLMALVIFSVIALALILLIIKWMALPSSEDEEPTQSRGFMTFIGALALCVFAGVVLMGTSAPFVTSLLGNANNVPVSFYNTWGLVLVVTIFFCLILATIYPWQKIVPAVKDNAAGKETKKNVNKTGDKKGLVETKEATVGDGETEPAEVKAGERKKTAIKIGVSVLGAVLFVAVGMQTIIENTLIMEILIYLGLATAGAVIALSVLSFVKGFCKGINKAALFTHIGLAVLVAGVIFSSAGSEKESPVIFNVGEEKTVLGRHLTYISIEDKPDGSGYVQRFNVDGTIVDIPTRIDPIYGFERKPAILRSLLVDYYVAPSVSDLAYTLSMNTPTTISMGDDKLELTLNEFGMASQDPSNPSVYVSLHADLNDLHEDVRLELVPLDLESGDFTTEPVVVFNKYNFQLKQVKPNDNQISMYVYGIDETFDQLFDQINVEVSTKPLINLVWLGTIMISAGTLWAALRRWGPSPFQDLHNRKKKKEAIM